MSDRGIFPSAVCIPGGLGTLPLTFLSALNIDFDS